MVWVKFVTKEYNIQHHHEADRIIPSSLLYCKTVNTSLTCDHHINVEQNSGADVGFELIISIDV